MNARELVTVMLEAEEIDWSPDPDDPDSSTNVSKLIQRYTIDWWDSDNEFHRTYRFTTPLAALRWAETSSLWNKAEKIELVNSDTYERWRIGPDYEVADAEGTDGTPRPIFSTDEPDGPKGYYSPPPAQWILRLHQPRLESRQNRYNPKGLHRARDGSLLDKWGRKMDVDWDEFEKRRIKTKDAGKPYPPRPAQRNPLHNATTYDPKEQDSHLHDKRKEAEKLVGDMLGQGDGI